MTTTKPADKSQHYAKSLFDRWAHTFKVNPKAAHWTVPARFDRPTLTLTTPNHRFAVVVRGVAQADDFDRLLVFKEELQRQGSVPVARALYIVRDISPELTERFADEGIFVADWEKGKDWNRWDDGTPY